MNNHHLTTIAALPSTAGAGSALIRERNPSRPRFELTPEDMAGAGYPVNVTQPEIVGYWSKRQPDGSYAMGYTLRDGTKVQAGTARVAEPPAPPAIHNFTVGDVATLAAAAHTTGARAAIKEAIAEVDTIAQMREAEDAKDRRFAQQVNGGSL